MRKKRILHVFGAMNCGGAETMLMNIYRNINKDNYQFSFLVHDTNPAYYDNEINELKGEIFYIESQGKLGLLRYIYTLKNFLLRNGPFDVVHSHMDWQGGAIAYASHLAGIKKIIIHSHTYASYKPSVIIKQVIKLEKNWINKFGTDFWACSQEAGDYLFKNDKDFRIIPNAINLENYLNPNTDLVNDIKKKYKINKDSLIIGHIGSFSENKNQKFIIDIAHKLETLNKDFRLLLVGNDTNSYASEVKALVEQYGLQQKIHFLGQRNDINNLVNIFDVFCFPSEFEGLGIVAVEAQAGGVPCLVSTGVPKYVDMGLKIVKYLPIGEVDHWVNSILEIRKSKLIDKNLIAEKIRQKGFDIKQSIKYLEKLY